MVTEFQQRVYDAISKIPRGKVSTYKLVAGQLGLGCPRAIGQALKRNPFAPHVPCHRVISSSLRIGGFAGKRSGKEIGRKLALLEDEGVFFGPDGLLLEPARVFSFESSRDASYQSQ